MARWTRTLERILLVCGLVLIGVYTGARIQSSVLSRAEVERFKDQVLSGQQADRELGTAKDPDFALWSPKRIQAYRESLAAHFSPALGLLRIPRINLEVPVLEGTDDISLNRAVGHITGTTRPGETGNIGVAGHRDGFFRGLKDISRGDIVELLTAKGVSTFAVDEISIVAPSDTSVLAPRAQTSITLVTCYPFYFIGSAPQRYIVQASLVGSSLKKVESGTDRLLTSSAAPVVQ